MVLLLLNLLLLRVTAFRHLLYNAAARTDALRLTGAVEWARAAVPTLLAEVYVQRMSLSPTQHAWLLPLAAHPPFPAYTEFYPIGLCVLGDNLIFHAAAAAAVCLLGLAHDVIGGSRNVHTALLLARLGNFLFALMTVFAGAGHGAYHTAMRAFTIVGSVLAVRQVGGCPEGKRVGYFEIGGR